MAKNGTEQFSVDTIKLKVELDEHDTNLFNSIMDNLQPIDQKIAALEAEIAQKSTDLQQHIGAKQALDNHMAKFKEMIAKKYQIH